MPAMCLRFQNGLFRSTILYIISLLKVLSVLKNATKIEKETSVFAFAFNKTWKLALSIVLGIAKFKFDSITIAIYHLPVLLSLSW